MFWVIDFLIVRPIVNILFVIYSLVGDFGLAILLFTIIVKLCMWPLVKRQMHQTKLMRKIQPELAQIKKNCNGNRQLESLQMMDLYKKHNIKPFRSIASLFIQLPIILSLFMAINVMVQPRPSAATCGYTNVDNCIYAPVRSFNRIEEIISKQQSYLDGQEYDFQPKLFGVVDLRASASSVFDGKLSKSGLIVLGFAIIAAFTQYWVTNQQNPSKSSSGRTFRQILKDAEAGKEPDQAELNAIASRQMTYMMPIMMFLVMFNFPGAIVFYYFLTNLISGLQQKIILAKSSEEMEIAADKSILKELKRANKIQEAALVQDKKSNKDHITRISIKDNKKRRK